MSQLSGNSCNIITLLPLGLDCDSINATTPDDTNGILALYITGGTPPYNVTWDNGSHGTLLTNLSPGEYTATVVDYYGDFSATTTCTVGYDTFLIEEFENCKDHSKIYYLADLPSIFTSGKTYGLTTQVGCWISSGSTFYTGQTYFNSFAEISSGPFDDCTECLPTPEPEPVYPENLCVQLFVKPSKEGPNVLYQQDTFSSGSTINGYPSWTSDTPTQVIYYNTGNTRWELTNFAASNPYFVTPIPPPLGTWTIPGYSSSYILIVKSGVCTTPPLTMSVRTSDPTCSKTHNGSITVSAANGTPPYQYSINGVNYQSSNVFTGLLAGTYTVYTKDYDGTIVTQSVTLSNQQVVQTYTVTLTPTTTTVLNGNAQITKTYKYRIEVTPPLPSNNSISFNIPISVLLTGTTLNTTPSVPTTQINSISFQTFGTSNVTGPTSLPATTTSNALPQPCDRITQYTSASTQTYLGSITGNSYIEGTIVQSITTPSIVYKTCRLYGNLKDTINLTNARLSNVDCSNLNSQITPISFETSLVGLVVEG
jgi:hypothetical protein